MSTFLATKEGLGIFPTMALILFVVAFALILHHTFTLTNQDVRKFENLPLAEEDRS
ncbi:MAG: hypothetical protein H3C47_12280 [Candidatus Cloacimonetes bacterium]|nr:hypothetical protein [Candidatus Cloacimonadota bacterium]